MADLKDYQFELDDYAFGLGLPMLLVDGGFDPGSASWRTQDQPHAHGDGTTFGRDQLDGPTWAWELGTDQGDPASALKVLADFSKAWRATEARQTPGAVLALRYALAGRTRRVYGRPRRLAAPPNNKILSGWIPVTCDFQTADALHYDDTEESLSVGITTSSAGGLTSPLKEPLATVTEGAETRTGINVGGDAPTWAVVSFTGPVSNPYVELGGWHCGLRGSLADGEEVTIDSRPWVRTAVRNDGASMGGRLDRKTYLDRMLLPPGGYEIVYGGGSSVATSTATVRWRSAFHAL